MRGIALVGLVDAILIGLALAIIGVPLVLPLMIITFFAAFVPLIGAFLVGLPQTFDREHVLGGE